jgi:CHAT domain-containing protein
VFQALDFSASKSALLGRSLRGFGILHFATHGVLDTQRPEQSGLVFSLLDRSGKPVDGFLRLHEIYNLDLDADLVVLSACRTALGKEVHGEGLIGLTRGFMYAGASRVVSSVWNVDDRASAELMKRFYEGMLIRKLAPAAALRDAQLSLLKDPRWANPHYWAAFGAYGEPR